MASTTLKRDHHLLTRNLKVNDNYISNDGQDEGISINDSGVVTMSSQLDIGNMSLTTSEIDILSGDFTLDVAGDINLNANGVDINFQSSGTTFLNYLPGQLTIMNSGDTADYARISVGSNGVTSFSTVDGGGNNAANLAFLPQGNIAMHPHGSQGLQIVPATKTVSYNHDATMSLSETLDGEEFAADGDDVHYGIRYQQTQTDLTGWDSVYLMYITGGDAARTFAIQGDGKVGMGVNDPDAALEILQSSTQLKLSYDATNYATFAISDDGLLNIVTEDPDGAEADICLNPDGNVGIGTTTPGALLEVQQGSTGGGIAFLIDNDDTDQNAMQIDAANIDVDVIDINAAGLTTADVIDITADSLTTGYIFDINASGLTDGRIFDAVTTSTVTDGGTPSLFRMFATNDGVGAQNSRGIYLDYNKSAITADTKTATIKGISLDIDDSVNNVGNVTMYGIEVDVDFANAGDGTTKTIGLHVDVGGADTNYAIITDGGNVGIGVSTPDQALEVNGDIHVENTVYFTAETANTIADGATGTINWNTSQKQKVTITGTGITCNFTDPAGPCNVLLKVVQGDGSDVIATWDSAIKWPTNDTVPTLSTGNGDIDIISFYFDGTNYFGVASLDFA